MYDVITFTRSERGGSFKFTTNWSDTGLYASEREPPVIPIVRHLFFIIYFSYFIHNGKYTRPPPIHPPSLYLHTVPSR